MNKAHWSSGQDGALSRRNPEFDSRMGHKNRIANIAIRFFITIHRHFIQISSGNQKSKHFCACLFFRRRRDLLPVVTSSQTSQIYCSFSPCYCPTFFLASSATGSAQKRCSLAGTGTSSKSLPETKKTSTFVLAFLFRRRRDLNSRAGYPTYTLSRGASSANLSTSPYI